MDMLNFAILQACGAGTAHSSGTPEFTPGFSGVRVVRSLVFCVVFFIDHCLSFWSLYCLFFDLRLLIIPLLSSNFC
jgi:hypothetical protein